MAKAKAVFDKNIERSKHFMQLRKDLLDAGKSAADVEDMLRAALSWSVAALDAYVHDKISEEVVNFIKIVVSLPTKTDTQIDTRNKLAAELIAFLDRVDKDERPGHLSYWSYSTKQRPFVQIRADIERLLLLKTYQEPSKIESGFKLIGCKSIFDGMAGGPKTPERAKMWKDLDEYSLRRNKIVHETDRMRGRRGSRATRGMTPTYVTRAINRISAIVGLMDAEVDKQLKLLKPAKPRGRKPAKPRGRPRRAATATPAR
jgi:hypothetical protein